MKEIEINNPYGFVYVTTNKINGKRYIGRCLMQTTRKNSWKYYLGSGKAFKQALKKYGKENFERTIISFAYTNEELNKQEKELIDFFDGANSNDYYNISDTYYYNFWEKASDEDKEIVRKKLSECSFWNTATEEEKAEKRKMMSEQFSGEKNPFYNKKHSLETLKKISESHKGKCCGDKNANYWKGKTGELHHFYGKHHSDKAKQKMSKSAKERVLRIGAPNCIPMSIVVNGETINFKTKKDCYNYCKDNELIPNTYYKQSQKTMLCYDSFKKRLREKQPFLLFTYEIDG